MNNVKKNKNYKYDKIEYIVNYIKNRYKNDVKYIKYDIDNISFKLRKNNNIIEYELEEDIKDLVLKKNKKDNRFNIDLECILKTDGGLMLKFNYTLPLNNEIYLEYYYWNIKLYYIDEFECHNWEYVSHFNCDQENRKIIEKYKDDNIIIKYILEEDNSYRLKENLKEIIVNL